MSGEYPKTEEYISYLRIREGNLRGIVNAKDDALSTAKKALIKSRHELNEAIKAHEEIDERLKRLNQKT